MRLDSLSAADTAGGAGAAPSFTSEPFTLMLRIPSWAVDGAVRIELNGLAYNGCPGAPLPTSYCAITR